MGLSLTCPVRYSQKIVLAKTDRTQDRKSVKTGGIRRIPRRMFFPRVRSQRVRRTSKRLSLFLHYFHRTAMFSDYAVATYKKQLRRNWHGKRRYDYEKWGLSISWILWLECRCFRTVRSITGFESVRFLKGSY